MTLEKILQGWPSREEIASAVGLETRRSAGGDLLAGLGIFGTGMMLGAGLALLFAPKPGQEIRHDIAERVGEMGDHLRAQMPRRTAASVGQSA